MAFLAVGVLALALRWIYGSRRPPRHRRHVPADRDFGLLEQVVLVPDRGSANALRAVLSDAGIRSTLAARRDGDIEVLVFPPDAERARRLVRSR